ncbi:Ammonium transporter [Homalodisca vitripennis]|nr:Ammonium transporter [Homalodisca vitripennis]
MYIVNRILPIRLSEHDELLGADLAEHRIKHRGVGVSHAVSQLFLTHPNTFNFQSIQNIGTNPGHEAYLSEYVQRQTQLQSISAHTSFRNKLNEIHIKDPSYIPQYAWVE